VTSILKLVQVIVLLADAVPHVAVKSIACVVVVSIVVVVVAGVAIPEEPPVCVK